VENQVKSKKGSQESLTSRIRNVGRLPVANACGMQYSTLCQKLNGYVTMTDEDRVRIEAAVRSLEQKKAA